MKPGTQPLGRVNLRAGFNNYGFLWFSVISLALLEENLVLLFSVDKNVMRERKWKQEKKKERQKGLGGWSAQGEPHGKRAKKKSATRGLPRRSPT